jgi:hypothetical protein
MIIRVLTSKIDVHSAKARFIEQSIFVLPRTRAEPGLVWIVK